MNETELQSLVAIRRRDLRQCRATIRRQRAVIAYCRVAGFIRPVVDRLLFMRPAGVLIGGTVVWGCSLVLSGSWMFSAFCTVAGVTAFSLLLFIPADGSIAGRVEDFLSISRSNAAKEETLKREIINLESQIATLAERRHALAKEQRQTTFVEESGAIETQSRRRTYEEFRWGDPPPTPKQFGYAIHLGCELVDGETKFSISEKIGAVESLQYETDDDDDSWRKAARDDFKDEIREMIQDNKQFRDNPLFWGIRIVVGPNCPHAKDKNGKSYSLSEALQHSRELPPFEQCSEKSCQCTIEPEVEQPKAGCLGTILLALSLLAR